MSDVTILILGVAAWLMIQYVIPLALSYRWLVRHEVQTEAGGSAQIHHRHLLTGA